MKWLIRRNRLIALGCAVAALSGCSTYVAHKVGPDGVLPPKSTGIPYTMTRPEYTVDITADAEDASKPVFVLKQTNVPDPAQRYTLALDPALLTNGKMDVTLGDAGNLAEASSTVTSQVVATIKAAASFAVDRIGVKGLKDEKSAFPELRLMIQSTHADCPQNVRTAIVADMDALSQPAEVLKTGSGGDAVVEQYYFKSLAQKACLQAVAAALSEANDKELPALKTTYSTAANLVLADKLPAPSAAIAKAQKGWVESNDAAAIKSAQNYVSKLDTATHQPLNDALTAAVAYVNKRIELGKTRAMASMFSNMTPATWRGRRAKALETQLDALRLDLNLAGGRNPTLEKAIADLEETHAEVIGGRPLLLRIRRIDNFLTEVRMVSAPDGLTRYAADEHVKLREERDKLTSQLKELATAAASGSDKATAKVVARAGLSARIVDEAFLKSVQGKPSVIFENLPEFVVVLKRIPPALDPSTAPLVKTR